LEFINAGKLPQSSRTYLGGNMLKPTKEQLFQAMEDRDEGRPITSDMEKALEIFDAAWAQDSAQRQRDADILTARALIKDYDAVLEKLSKIPESVLTLLASESPHSVRAARGKLMRDANSANSTRVWAGFGDLMQRFQDTQNASAQPPLQK
jgi:hypothetical protein